MKSSANQDIQITGNVGKIITIETVVGNVLVDNHEARDREIEYLIGMVNELGKKDGVLQYVELTASASLSTNDERGFSKLASKGETLTISSVWDMYNKYSSFVILGNPGSGKTTTLRFLAFELAKKRLEEPHSVPIPFFLYLSEWDSEETLEDFIRSKWVIKGDPVQLVKKGNVILFLDGLNELGDISDKRIEMLKNWADVSNSIQTTIISCRTAEYRRYGFENIQNVSIKDFSEAQIKQLAQKYLGSQTSSFLERVKDRQSLIDLARNPYVLRALTILYEISPNEDLPQNIGALFHRLAQALFERELIRGTVQENIHFNSAQAAFSTLAFAMMKDGKSTEVPEAYAIQIITDVVASWFGKIKIKQIIQGKAGKRASLIREQTKELLEVGNNANWIIRNNGRIKFYHQLLLEYFAAASMTFQKDIHFPPLRTTPYGAGNEWIPSRWDQIFIVLSGILEEDDAPMDEYIDACMSANPHLAAQCVLSGISVSIETRQKLIAILSSWVLRTSKSQIGESMKMSMIQFGIVPDWIRIYVNLVKGIADENCIEVLVAAIYSGDYMLTSAAAMALGSLGKQGVTALTRILNNEDNQKSWFAEVAAIGLDSVDDPSCVPELSQLLDNHLPTPTHSGSSMMRLTSIGNRASSTLERIGTPEALEAIKNWKLANT
jgi:hypothetical protein